MYNIKQKLLSNKSISYIFVDVDGVIKDLYSEHSQALNDTICMFSQNKKRRKRFILRLNMLTRPLIACGIIPTSSMMQKFLLLTYSIILFENPKKFFNAYKDFYKNKTCMFKEVVDCINSLNSYTIIFVSMNSQSMNLSKYGLCDFEIYISKYNKTGLIKSIIDEKGIKKEEVLIIGDNYLHDYIPARLLKVDYVIVDCYDNKFKQKIKKTAL